MKSIKKYQLAPKYSRDNGVQVFEMSDLPLPSNFTVQETSIVVLPAGQIAGNHKHPRREAYFTFDEGVKLHWIDEAGETHIKSMTPADGLLRIFVIPAFIPHGVINTSQKRALLHGYADGPLVDVERVEVISL